MSYDATEDDTAPIIAATFTDRQSAHRALAELHRAGFRKVWLGVTRADTLAGDRPTIEAEDAGSFMEALGRFFSGEESRGGSLHEALVAHGLSEAHARRIDGSISPGNAVVVVDGEYDPAQAMRILKISGGELDSNATTASDLQRLELREERLADESDRVRDAEARDVPAFREELFVERRPAREADVRAPLTAERADVSQRAVVTDEAAIAKRPVAETRNVSHTVRRDTRRSEQTADMIRVEDDAPLCDY